MASQYYYLISSLPYLRLGETPRLGSGAFLALAAEHLPDSLCTELRAVGLLPRVRPCCAAERVWTEGETAIRNRILEHAGGSKSAAARQWERPEAGVQVGAMALTDEAMNAPDPLTRERRLDELRWRTLDEAAVDDPFGFGALIVYRLRLLLVEKWQAFDREAGRTRIQTLADDILHRTETDPVAGIAVPASPA